MIFTKAASGFKQLVGVASGVGAGAFAYTSLILCSGCSWVDVAFVEVSCPAIAINRREREPVGEVDIEVEIAVKRVRVVFAPVVL